MFDPIAPHQSRTMKSVAIDLLECGVPDGLVTEHISWLCSQRYPQYELNSGTVNRVVSEAKEESGYQGKDGES